MDGGGQRLRGRGRGRQSLRVAVAGARPYPDVWLDETTHVLSGANVAQWQSRTKARLGGNFVTPNAAAAGITQIAGPGGRPVVSFPASDGAAAGFAMRMARPWATGDGTLLIAMQKHASGARSAYSTHGTNEPEYLRWSTNTSSYVYFARSSKSNLFLGLPGAGVWFLHGIRGKQGAWEHRLNGAVTVASAPALAPTWNFATWYLGGNAGVGTQAWGAPMAEVRLWNAYLSDAQLAAHEQEMLEKWVTP